MSDPSIKQMAAQAGLTVQKDSTTNVRVRNVAPQAAGMGMNEGLLKFAANDSVPAANGYSGTVSGTVSVSHTMEYYDNGQVVGAETQTREISYSGDEHFSGDNAHWEGDGATHYDYENGVPAGETKINLGDVGKIGIVGAVMGSIQGLFNVNKGE